MYKNAPTPDFIRPAEVVREFGAGLTEARLRQLRWLRAGPPYCKIRNSVYYARTAIAEWLARNTVDPSKDASDSISAKPAN